MKKGFFEEGKEYTVRSADSFKKCSGCKIYSCGGVEIASQTQYGHCFVLSMNKYCGRKILAKDLKEFSNGLYSLIHDSWCFDPWMFEEFDDVDKIEIKSVGLNLVDVLRKCHVGMSLYSTVHGYCSLEALSDCDQYPIIISVKTRDGLLIKENFTSDGRLSILCNGECVLFPSHENRDWSALKFNNLKEGEPVMVSHGTGWSFEYYSSKLIENTPETLKCQYIVPFSEFDTRDLKSNIEKSVI